MWKLFYSGFISKQIKVAYCRCAVTNEFIHKCWVCFGNKCCFVFFICNKTFTALLPNDQPACVMIFRKDLHLVYQAHLPKCNDSNKSNLHEGFTAQLFLNSSRTVIMEDSGCAALTVESNTPQKQSTKTFDCLHLKKRYELLQECCKETQFNCPLPV